ncbi:MAG: DUF4968 domain-containing protein [Sphingobacteriales bacterium]|nr:DUF4968 domain-containing protein [Sphingobacteriales bacterium]
MTKKKNQAKLLAAPILPENPNERKPDVVKRFFADNAVFYQTEGNQYTIYCNNKVALTITVLSTTMLQFKYSFDGDFDPNFSYAIAKTFHPDLHAEQNFTEHLDFYELKTKYLICRIAKKGLLITLLDAQTFQIINQDEKGFYLRHSLIKGTTNIKITKKAPSGEAYFGLGDKSGALNLRGRAYENWCTDSFAYTQTTDPLYRAVPFYYGLTAEGLGYGIFLDNTYQTRFSFDRKNNQVMSFSARGGEMNYYFIYGPQLLTVSQQYHFLTGYPELPPLWALGYHQCRWSYYPEAKVRQIASTFRELQIPCDAIYLDIDYMQQYKCFTWNEDYFPNPDTLIEDLKDMGFKTVVMINPGIRTNASYWVYQSGKEAGVFCHRPDGKLVKAPVWPPECVFPDFTHPKARAWWGQLYKGLVDNGVAGIWNDMNEPAVFEVARKTFPNNVLHHYDGHTTNHKKAHNIYGMQMARATFNGLKQLRPQTRPFVLTRASYAGGQRYAAVWTGDNIATWEHLRIACRQCLQLSMSGFSMCGSDIGGFVDQPSPLLYLRWLQLSIFHVVMRTHTMGFNVDGAAAVNEDTVAERQRSLTADQEPWSYGPTFTDLCRQAIEWRYKLLPFLYTAMYFNAKQGLPVIAPLCFYEQFSQKTRHYEHCFVVGQQILTHVATDDKETETVKNENSTVAQFLTLPDELGTWYNFWDGTPLQASGFSLTTSGKPLHQFPFYIKAGSILPLYPVQQYTNQNSIEQLQLNIYLHPQTSTSFLYEDAGEGYAYQQGEYSLQSFTMQYAPPEYLILRQKEGQFMPSYSSIALYIFGFPFENIANLVLFRDDVELVYTVETNNCIKTIINANFNNIKISC